MPLRHADGLAHAPPFGAPQRPSLAHTPDAHCAARVHGVPLFPAAAHAPLLQKLPALQSASSVHPLPHFPDAHAPLRHGIADVHVVPSGSPHLPSTLHSFDRHSVARVHGAPFASVATHAPLAQYAPTPHCESCTHVAAHAPLTHASLRHAEPLVHDVPFGSPHRPSLKHTPLRQSPFFEHGVPLIAPHVSSAATQIPLRQTDALVHAPPFGAPHFPSDAHTPLRHTSDDAHPLPFESPHFPSPLHTPLRHAAAAVHARSFGVPHRLSLVSQTPLTHTRAPLPLDAVVHVPLSGAFDGMGSPFGTFASHTPAPMAPVGSSHHLPGQSASSVHSAPHAPLVTLQMPPWCAAPVHCALVVHLPHEPSPAQYGLPDVGHALAPVPPLSTVHEAHAFVAALHTGVVPLHAPLFVAVHATHWFVCVLHAGVAPPQFASPVHGSHRPAFAPLPTHAPVRH
jgi:hypothetical protein